MYYSSIWSVFFDARHHTVQFQFQIHCSHSPFTFDHNSKNIIRSLTHNSLRVVPPLCHMVFTVIRSPLASAPSTVTTNAKSSLESLTALKCPGAISVHRPVEHWTKNSGHWTLNGQHRTRASGRRRPRCSSNGHVIRCTINR